MDTQAAQKVPLAPGLAIQIGVDVGGTFTDAVLEAGGRVWTAKFPTSADVCDGVLGACRATARRAGTTLPEILPRVTRFGLGTTAVTNAIASRRGVRVGLLTTRGFEQTLQLARGRVVATDLRMDHGPQLVAPEDIVGIAERIDRHGSILEPMDPEEVLSATARLVEAGVEAVAISFLWSTVQPEHEVRAARAIAQAWPELPVSSGAALLPALREYERTTLAVLNAYVSRAFSGVDELSRRLSAEGLQAPLLLVHSGGGSISVDEARRRPVWLAESGPAAGVAAAADLAGRSGASRCITCDMGGTSFDVSDVGEAGPSRTHRGELMGIWTALPRVDVESIGAGGGSIAWVDARGMLRVGPKSAGSSPGPVCYRRGGAEPTVTDALVALHYIDPERFLGGEMALDRGAALAACAELGTQLGLDAEATAWGIREIALAEMTKAVRTRLALRGLDPREHALISYGGCASLFTAEIARVLGAPRVIVPEVASVLSALGAATLRVRRERVRTVLRPMPIEVGLLSKLGGELRAQVAEDLSADGVGEAARAIHLEADLRFVRQTWELSIPLAEEPWDASSLDALLDAFREEYVRRYGAGSILLGTPIELVALRAVGVEYAAPVEDNAPVESAAGATASHRARAGRSRPVRFGAAPDARLEVPAFDDVDLPVGATLPGPALIDRADTTLWVPEGVRARRDEHRSILLEIQ